jgi:hypothetical protein
MTTLTTMTNFNDVILDIFTNTPGGMAQATARFNALQASGYRSHLSGVTTFVQWANHLPGGLLDTASQAPASAVLMLTSFKP